MIAWNDRRKAKNAASSEMKKNISAMAKAKTLRATPTPEKDPGGWKKHDAQMERNAVHSKARDYSSDSRGERYQRAAQMVDMNLKQGKDAYGHGKK